MDLVIKLTKRTRKRKNRDGSVVLHDRYVLNFRDPRTEQRRQLFFDHKKDGEAQQRAIMVKAPADVYVDERSAPTIEKAVELWLADRETNIRSRIRHSTHTDRSPT